MGRLVIFDLDGTLANVNVSFAFSKFLFKNGLLSPIKMLSLISMSLLYRYGLCSVDRVHALGFAYILRGKRVEQIDAVIEQFLQQSLPDLFRPYLLERLLEAQAAGDCIWLLSSSPDAIVKPIAAYLGIDTVLATSYLREEGRYEQIAHIVDGQAKRQFLENFLKSSHVKREETIAYSDSMQDISLLESVGSVVAVCPDAELKKIAINKRWPIWEDSLVDFVQKS